MIKTELGAFMQWFDDHCERALKRGFIEPRDRMIAHASHRSGKARKRPGSEWREKKHLSGGVRF